jgi:hypothetical protein
MKQSFTRIYHESQQAAECRQAVNQLNMKRRDLDQLVDSKAEKRMRLLECGAPELESDKQFSINAINPVGMEAAETEKPTTTSVQTSKWSKYGYKNVEDDEGDD